MSKFEVIINTEQDSNAEWEAIPRDTLVCIIKNGVFVKDSYYDIVNKIMDDDNKIMLITDVLLQNEFNEYYIERLEDKYTDSFPYFLKKTDHANPFNPNIIRQIQTNLSNKLIEHLSEPVFRYAKKIL
jgi:hypothetical protein